MGELFEVKEFDKIIANADFKDDDNFKYLHEDVFNDLVNFIQKFDGDKENADILGFMRVGYKRNVGNTITIKNYVGLIQMRNGNQIQVLPKISFCNGEDKGNDKTKRTFLKMLSTMKNFPCKVFNDALLKVDKMNLYEIFINMYLQEVRQLVKRGIKSAYVQQEDNLKYYKGKLLINKHIQKNIVHKERFYVAYDEFHPNRAENKLVKATLLKLQKLTNSAQNSKEIRQLLTAFEMVEPSVNYQKDFSKVHIDRNTSDYRMLMQWSKIFLMNKSFTTFSGNDQSRALLFPMESVYESYVAHNIKRIMGSDGWNITTQDRSYYLFMEPRKQFSLRPDIVLKKKDRIIIMDTKWKKLISNERKNYGISQTDMYQMYAYSKKYGTSEIWLLYPINDDMRERDDICFDSGDGTVIKIFFIDVANIEDNIIKLKEKVDSINLVSNEKLSCKRKR